MSLILDIEDVDAGYGQIDVLFSMKLPVARGRITAVLGPNGAGKTTTLKVAAGLMKPHRGTVRLNGQNIAGQGARAIARKGLCLIPEGRGIFPSLSVRENLVLQSKMSKTGLAGVEEIAYAQFPVLGVRRKQIAGTLSGGEQQMLALSRALTSPHDVILIDEISMGLAPNLIERLFDVIAGLAKDGRTIVLVEQLAEFAMEIADYVAVVSRGRMAAIGQPHDVSELLQELYLGAADSAVEAAEATYIERGDDTLWVTSLGTLSHMGSCPIVTDRTDVRALGVGESRQRCDICSNEPAVS